MSAHSSPTSIPHYTVSVAPMMECTDRHFRYLARLFSPSALLYTEMISASAVVHGNSRALLSFHEREHPIALQIGSGDAKLSARAVEIAEEYKYDEYNLNVGCPSPKVQKGLFGAQLMAAPEQVRDIVRAMKSSTEKPVTIKHRLGINRQYDYDDLRRFLDVVLAAEPDRVIVHARIAVLDGLSPKQNRIIPPILYEEVYRLKEHFNHLPIEINGEVEDVDSIHAHLRRMDGVMIGREVYRNPRMLLSVQKDIFQDPLYTISEDACIEALQKYLVECQDRNVHIALHRMHVHLSGLYYCRAGAKEWRNTLHHEVNHPHTESTYQTLSRAIATAYRQMRELSMRHATYHVPRYSAS